MVCSVSHLRMEFHLGHVFSTEGRRCKENVVFYCNFQSISEFSALVTSNNWDNAEECEELTEVKENRSIGV